MIEYHCLMNYLFNHSTSDVKEKYLCLIGQLTDSPDMSDKDFLNSVLNIEKMGKTIIGVSCGHIVCSGTIIIEPKIIHGGKSVGHIEDIVVLRSYRNQGIGAILLEQLKQYGFDHNCYKIILDCNENLEEFYGKSGFSKKGIQMEIR